jgi:hypothetical protein
MKWICIVLVVFSCFVSTIQAQQIAASNPGCEHQSAKECLNLALGAMGGRERLREVRSVRLETIGHTLLMEQSYRQDPFITSYERATTTLDLANQRVLSEVRLTWPESDDNQSESTSVAVVGPEGGVRRGKDADTPCSLADLDTARYALALGPVPLLLTADQASDLHFEKPEMLRSTRHTVLAFSWQKVPVRILLNRFNHLPDAVETTQQFHDFWYFWGDVWQRVYFDNWKLVRGVAYPTNLVEERNGAIWRSAQALKVELNAPVQESAFRMDAATAKKSIASLGWKRPFRGDTPVALAPGIDFFPGPWNSTIVRQSDGTVIVEAPIGEPHTQGVIEEAKKRYPRLPIKAVLSTSDSWPHTGGVRFAVSQGLPVYILDLNRPLLDRLIEARHSVDPDSLEKSITRKPPMWRIVSAREQLGTGPNRLELYPLRGASTERQYMVYFPEQHLLYASDTLVINEDNTLYDPELMNEVVQAVRRENLQVDRVFAMHQGPTAWNHVLDLLEKSQHPQETK